MKTKEKWLRKVFNYDWNTNSTLNKNKSLKTALKKDKGYLLLHLLSSVRLQSRDFTNKTQRGHYFLAISLLQEGKIIYGTQYKWQAALKIITTKLKLVDLKKKN